MKKIENKNTELFIDEITNVSMESEISSNIIEDLILFANKGNVDKKISDMAVKAVNIIKTGGEL